MTALIIHGHFYQPPREDPWTGEVERQQSAAPFHDWNERIHDECYGPNAFAHIVGPDGVIQGTVNNYANISFNFGPTLLSWLERHHPLTYQRILEADRESAARRNGHGNAIAQAYGHAILPLCNERDRLTQVVWGIADFVYRFGRQPESLWLPETACNDATLDLLIDQGMRFVILAPDQAARHRQIGSGEWHNVAESDIDTSRTYRYVHQDGSGRSISVFFYQGQLARAIAFEKALLSSDNLVRWFKQVASRGGLINAATDGETYGHHFRFGDLCLAHALEIEAKHEGFSITNYGEYLDQHPPEFEVEIRNGQAEGTSWSCAHGVGRWNRDCGCYTGGQPGWNQKWRAPLRAAFDFLRDDSALNFESLGRELLIDPWAARNSYIKLMLDQSSREQFFREHARGELSPAERERALALLEIQRNSLLMFTSCGWFFSELSGIETVQIMKYAARIIELQDRIGLISPRKEFLKLMSAAQSNLSNAGTGADIYLRHARPASLLPSDPGHIEAAVS